MNEEVVQTPAIESSKAEKRVRNGTTIPVLGIVVAVLFIGCMGISLFLWGLRPVAVSISQPSEISALARNFPLQPRPVDSDSAGFGMVVLTAAGWPPETTLEEMRQIWLDTPRRLQTELEQSLTSSGPERYPNLKRQMGLLSYEGKSEAAYEKLVEIRKEVEQDAELMANHLAELMYLQGVLSLRIAEDQNCILCRGESSCILPIAPAAIHKFPEGSRQAIRHFTEYLREFPDDLEVLWLLNVAHMTLGEYPEQVNPQYLLNLDKYNQPAPEFGKFRDVGHLLKVNRFNQAGGVVMDDLDNDGRLDLFVTTFDHTQPAALYRNLGNGTFEECGATNGIAGQYGGLVCTQGDYNNDGLVDIFIGRGAWLPARVRPTLLRNDGNLKFTDVTVEAGLLDPLNTNAVSFADYDNDGWLDLLICCERQRHRLYRNRGDGTFEERSEQSGSLSERMKFSKGITWIDYDNDNYPDIFASDLFGTTQLHHNERDGTFRDVTVSMGIDGPPAGFACWAWDYDNDGWQDIFATCYDRTLKDVVRGLIGQPHDLPISKLYRNLEGKGFEDVTRIVGLDQVYETMGCNFADFDNDGYLDMYLGTGEPSLASLVPNRMFWNQQGKSFREVTGAAGVGHLQKGHAIACGDWDNDGNIDIFAQTGGATNGDKYHNIMFQNPGHPHAWITLKLVGTRTNRSAIGARIKLVTAGPTPQTIHRHVTVGGSFGSSPLQQTIGLGPAEKIALLEIHWPASDSTQAFENLHVRQAIEITEGKSEIRQLEYQAIQLPRE